MTEYEKKIEMRVADYDEKDELKPSAVLGIFQDIASKHGEELGVGYETMKKNGKMWVVLRCRYDVFKYPPFLKEVTVKSKPMQPTKIEYDREYSVLDKDGELCLRGRSKWCVVNAETRRIAFDGAVKYNIDDFDDVSLYEGEPFSKIKDFPVDGFDMKKISVRTGDLDHNGHVNNACYGDYILDVLDKDFHIASFSIDFINEIESGSVLELFYKMTAEGYYIKCISNGKENFRAIVKEK